MELRHLRYFVTVASELHFGRAAERLFISQPALSQQIRSLEGELGFKLLERNSRGVQLTPEGEAFLAEGEVSLYAAKVGRNLNCGKGRFENRGGVALNAAGVQVGGILFWTGVSTSGYYVMTGHSPTVEDLATMLCNWPSK